MTTLFDPNSLVQKIDVVDPNKDYLTELVGEGKKFSDAKALARAKAESDTFIQQLQSEAKQLRDALTRAETEVKTRTSLDDFLQKVKEAQAKPVTTEPPVNQDTTSDQNVLNEEKINQIIESRLTAKERAEREASNIRLAQDGLVNAFGHDYVPALAQKAEELGVDSTFLDALAKSNPKVFFATLGINPNAQKTVFTNPPNTVNPGRTVQTGAKTYKHYTELRKKLPAGEYLSPTVQQEMFEARKQLGDAFYD